MSLVYSGIEPQPSLAWQFESSNVDSVTALAPTTQVSPGPAQLQGSATLVTNAPTSNTAVRFPGVSGSYMNLGTSSPTNFNHSTSNIFVESWVNVNSFSTNPQVYVRYTAALFTDFNFYFAPDGSMQVIMKDGTTGTNYTASNTFAMSTGVWYHVAFSYETINKNVTVFVNGYPGTAVTLPNPPRYTSAIPITIGGNDITNSHNLYIRDLRVFQGGIVPTTTFTPVTAPFSMNVFPTYMTGGTIAMTLLGQFITYVPGRYNTGMRIANKPGTNPSNYLRYTTSLNSVTGFTMSWWFNLEKYNSSINQNAIVLSGGGYGNLGILVSGTTSVYWAPTTGCIVTVYKSQSFSDNQWINLCLTYRGNQMVLYRDGVPFATGYTTLQISSFTSDGLTPSTITAIIPPEVRLQVGLTAIVSASGASGTNVGLIAGTYVITGVSTGSFTYVTTGQVIITGQPTSKSVQINNYVGFSTNFTTINVGGTYSDAMNGVIDDIRIYNTALSAAQVQSIYSTQGAPAPNNLKPEPAFMWEFQGSNVDYVTNLSPAFSTTTTSTTFLPTYQSGKYNLGISLPNTGGNTANTWIRYDFTRSIPADSGVTLMCWVNYTTMKSTTSAVVTLYDSATASFANTLALGLTTTSSLGYNNTGSTYNAILTPNAITGTFAAGVWYHLAVTFTSGAILQYVNGVPSVAKITGPTGISFIAMRLGTYTNSLNNNAGFGVADCMIDDLRIFDSALTSFQINAIYATQGVPSRGASGLSLPLDKVSGQVSGAYSTRLIRSAYTGPVVRVRRNSDSTQLDFISDVTGNLSNVSSAVSIASWLSSTTGNVSTWYDQSGGSNNFTQSITSQQPQIVQNGGKWVLWFNRDATPTFYSNLNCATTMTGIKTIVYNFNTIYNNYQTILGAEQSDNTGFRFNSNKIIGDAQSGRLGQDFLAAAGSYWYLNGAYGYMISNDGTTGVPSGNYIYNDLAWNHVVGVQNGGGMDGFGFNAISSPQLSIKGRAMNGYMSEIILFRNQLSAADSLYLYNSRYISRGSQIALTGTPLFSQLSSAATASAVGAFSLRAVNGVTARAVQVRPQAQFPLNPMTAASTTLTGYAFGGAGTYVARASSNYFGESPFYAFNKEDQLPNSVSRNLWTCAASSFNTTTGEYTGAASTTIDGAAYKGEWLQISLPVAIVLTNYTIFTWYLFLNRGPRNFKIAGSNDGTTWTTVDTQTGIINWTAAGFSFTTTSTTAYSYFRLCINYNNGDSTYVSITELKLTGYSTAWNTDFYADRLGNLLTAPVTGQTLSNWLGGATGYVTTWYDQSGAGNHVSQTVAARQPSITTTGTIVFSGAQSFSNTATTGGCLAASAGTGTKYSYGAVWNPSALSGYQSICEHNSSTGISSKRSSLLLANTNLGFNGQGNDIQALIGSLVTGTQYSTVARIDNTTAGYTANGNKNVRMRQNGTDYSGDTNGGYASLNLDNYQFVIGKKATTSGEFFNGSMKSIMVFKDALSDADTALLHSWQQSI